LAVPITINASLGGNYITLLGISNWGLGLALAVIGVYDVITSKQREAKRAKNYKRGKKSFLLILPIL
jgi:hypothetical protein